MNFSTTYMHKLIQSLQGFVSYKNNRHLALKQNNLN